MNVKASVVCINQDKANDVSNWFNGIYDEQDLDSSKINRIGTRQINGDIEVYYDINFITQELSDSHILSLQAKLNDFDSNGILSIDVSQDEEVKIQWR